MARPMSWSGAPGRTASIARSRHSLGDAHQSFDDRVEATDAEGRVGVAVHAVDVDGDVEVDDVALDERAVVGDAVADHFVHRRAHRLREVLVAERARVDAACDVRLVRDAVDLVGGDAGCDGGADLLEDVARDRARDLRMRSITSGDLTIDSAVRTGRCVSK